MKVCLVFFHFLLVVLFHFLVGLTKRAGERAPQSRLAARRRLKLQQSAFSKLKVWSVVVATAETHHQLFHAQCAAHLSRRLAIGADGGARHARKRGAQCSAADTRLGARRDECGTLVSERSFKGQLALLGIEKLLAHVT